MRVRWGMFVMAIAAVVLIASVTLAVPKSGTAKPAGKSFFEYPATTGNIVPDEASPPATKKLIKHGEWVYRGLCIGCHGVKGDGEGAVWKLGEKYAGKHKLPRRPRDFEGAVFKIRSTPSGSLPTDLDLFKTISRGLVADQDMPAFKFLPERDRWAVIAYIKTISNRWVDDKDYQEPPIKISRAPLPTRSMIVAGKAVYIKMKCAKCHGDLGKGDGPSAPELKDDNGLSIVPRDFTDPSLFIGGNDPRSIYQTFTTGLDGTPMPSYADFLNEDQRWQLVWYVMSLRTGWSVERARQEVQQGASRPAVKAGPRG